MIGVEGLTQMRDGAVSLNALRGTVVVIDALCAELRSGELGVAALDVFPCGPTSSGAVFESPLQGLDNAVLTPHAGESTEEAQDSVGVEAADKQVKFTRKGSTVSVVNFPKVALPPHQGSDRVRHLHRNGPGEMASVNSIFSDSGTNISGEFLQTNATVGYVVVDFDISEDFDLARLACLKRLEGALRARIVHR